nr:hypothetical protein [Piscirickettsia salmonis]
MNPGDQIKIPNRVGIEHRPAIADEKTQSLVILKLIRLWVAITNLIY